MEVDIIGGEQGDAVSEEAVALGKEEGGEEESLRLSWPHGDLGK